MTGRLEEEKKKLQSRAVVVVKWSANLPSTPKIRVWCSIKFVFEKNEQ